MTEKKMLREATWKEFKDAGLLWFVNRTLHMFGWALVFSYDNENDEEEITRVYIARCSFRGFSEDVEDKGFKNLTQHMKDNVDLWLDDVKE